MLVYLLPKKVAENGDSLKSGVQLDHHYLSFQKRN